MKKNLISKTTQSFQYILAFTIIVLFLGSWGCNKNEEADFTSDFNYEFKDNNHVLFTNASTGEYYSLTWDFGNGETETTTDKKKSFEIYYPAAGDYDISLKVINYTGGSKTTKKTIAIAASDLVVSFTANPDPTDPNSILLKNTSQGDYESFKWLYRSKVVENVAELSAYFPFAGNYEIELQVSKNNNIFSEKKSVNIAQDDPNYIENLTLIWSDEFDGTSVNTNNWTFETGASGWGNAELQNYTNGDNAEVVDGKLIITARKVNDNTEPGSYTSSRIKTQGKKEFQYGRMEIRAKLPSGTGIWPAIWMLGSNFGSAGWPACGEMDIMEYVGYQPNTVFSTVHTTSGSGGNGSGSSMNVPTCEEEFHQYGLIWTEKKLVFYVDETDNVVHTYSPATKTIENWPFDQPGFFILNVAVGGTWGGAQGVDNSIFPQSMEIDYVRVYQEAK
jgi:beta-glucanase (GH16 family)